MKTSVLIALLVAVLASGALASTTSSSEAPSQLLYGHVKSVTRTSHGFQLRFDPAWWLTGTPAEHACGCRPVANDYWIVDETHKLLTYTVRPDAHVSVLIRGTTRVGQASISVAELAQIVAGKNPKHRELLEPKAGFWIRVLQKYPSPISSLVQQYQP
jgi:hypothetical protein